MQEAERDAAQKREQAMKEEVLTSEVVRQALSEENSRAVSAIAAARADLLTEIQKLRWVREYDPLS